jgi:hypothetical protein
MAPEQLRNEDIDRRCDVYAAGVMLWELLTGRRRFRADSEGAVVTLVLTGPKQSPRDVVPSVPEAIDAVCMRAMERDANDRYPTAMAFAEALENAAIASGISIATPRAVAAFVNELGAHERPDLSGIEAPVSIVPSSRTSRPAAETPSIAPTTPREIVSTTNDVASVVVSNVAGAPGAGRKRTVLIAAGAAVLLGVTVLLVKAIGGGDSAPAAAAHPAETALAAAVIEPPPPTASVEASATIPATSASASASIAPPQTRPAESRRSTAPSRPAPTPFHPSDL